MGTFSGNPLAVTAAHSNLQLLQELGTEGYDELYHKRERLAEGLREILTDDGHDVYIPDFAGFFCLHFTDDETDPSQWHDWCDITPQPDPDMYEQFASAMIGEGIFFPSKTGRINLTHAHTDQHIHPALKAAKNVGERHS